MAFALSLTILGIRTSVSTYRKLAPLAQGGTLGELCPVELSPSTFPSFALEAAILELPHQAKRSCYETSLLFVSGRPRKGKKNRKGPGKRKAGKGAERELETRDELEGNRRGGTIKRHCCFFPFYAAILKLSYSSFCPLSVFPHRIDLTASILPILTQLPGLRTWQLPKGERNWESRTHVF